MKHPMRWAVLLLLIGLFAGVPFTALSQVYEPLPGPGKKVPMGKDYSLVYSFDKKPRMGTVILKLEVFDKEGNRDAGFKIMGDVDMPSMKGAHGSGPVPFQQSKKGDYLLALNLMMPGDWEVQMVFTKDKTVIYRGSIRFHV